MRLRDEVAIITGGNSGIGRATAELFAKEGAKVAIAARNEKLGEETVAAIRRLGGEAIFIATDVAREPQVRRMGRRTAKAFGKISVLFNNAGVFLKGSVVDIPIKDWDQVMNVNVKGVFLCSRYVIPEMTRAGGGSIINCSSVSGVVGNAEGSAYNASKGAVQNLTKNMALDFVGQGIRVNNICPGVIETPMLVGDMTDPRELKKARRRSGAKQVMGRWGRAEEVAEAVLFLASRESSYVNGNSIFVDGGLLARWGTR
jgi:NAD(P)-dependent dehydrogenase (short-subunit alcohol dehydrogenase family)